MRQITLLLMMAICFVGFSQQEVVQDFESSPAVAGFEGLASATLVADNTGGGNGIVFELVTNPNIAQEGINPWQGAEVILADDSVLDLTSDITIKVDVYSTVTFYPMAKVETTGSAAAAPFAANTQKHNGTGWETLTFTFNTSSDNTATANGVYNKVVFFPNRNSADDGWSDPALDATVLFDNITGEKTTLGGGGSTGNLPTTAAPTPPARLASDVISIFSDAYASISVDTFDVPWCAATTTEVDIDSNPTKKVTGLGCEGIDWQGARTIDASDMTYFHIDIWTDSDTADKSFNMKFSNWAGGAGEANAIEFSTTNASNPALPNPNPGTWISLDIPLSDWGIVTNGDISDIVQFVITSDLGIVYYDNLYLHKNTTLSTNDFAANQFSAFPNPTSGNWNIKSSNTNIQNIEIFNTLGRLVKKVEVGNTDAVIDASDLSSGIYFAKIYNDNNQNNTIKLMKR